MKRLPPFPAHLRAPALGVVCVGTCALVTWPETVAIGRRLSVACAWVGMGLLATSLLLMVREPRITGWLGGIEAMYRWHHRSGTLAYVLVLVHPLALAFESGLDPGSAWAALSPGRADGATRLGWASLLLLMLGLASTFALRLRYRVWRGLHALLAIGIAAGIAHAHAAAGTTVVLAVLTLLCITALVARFVVGELGLDAHPYVVAAVEPASIDTVEATMRPASTPLAVEAGQFVLAAFGEGPRYRGCGEFHPFTVSRVGADGTLELAIKALGPCTSRLQHLAPGTPVRLQGPFGNFLPEGMTRPQLWVAGGIGITPFMAAIRARPLPEDSVLVYVYRRQRDALFRDELHAHADAAAGFRLITLATGESNPDFAALLSQVDRLAEREIRICGPRPMLDTLLLELECHGAPRDSIHFELFDFR
ncbi:MAG: ferric reductase-like transmembrane domain-containing protein [Ectothiorhodospiraceae bacterium]|nr:ferric reductase-like transmembrane domain-containing protein [Ectothiorhodospiraceae bacterium]